MPAKKGRKQVFRCLSCKKLRIKCDLARPKCEYCAHTKRDCIYPNEGNESSTKPTNLASDLPLTQTSKLLSVTQDELRALKFFDEKGKFIVAFKNQRYIDMWMSEITPQFQSCPTVRKDSSVLTSSFSVDLSQTGQKFFELGVRLLKESINERQIIEKKATSFFGIKHLLTSDLITFGCILFYNHKLVPLLSFNQVDIITLTQQYREARLKHLEQIQASSISALFFPSSNPLLKAPEESTLWFTEMLYLELSKNHGGTEEELETLKGFIALLRNSIFAMSVLRFPFPLLACFTNFSDEFRVLLHRGNKFALRFLFIYSCLCVVSRIPLHRNDNIFTDYILWYKNRVFLENHKFDYPIDAQLFYLVTRSNFVIDFGDMSHFNPLDQGKKFINLDWLQDYIATLKQ
ncbi:putative zinc finger upstream protein 3 [Candida maltosa Xu316]|uniref:Putative zinc finger upstream protein 3 n=1 Tax=Candida maltosa (strain Xu316) TaxID=1245528 RepID=M3IVL5_CANMX|nr:putative zinc finger upstream protein 3 [Candida maltosa Xu316]